jgi:hypothetical protein
MTAAPSEQYAEPEPYEPPKIERRDSFASVVSEVLNSPAVG